MKPIQAVTLVALIVAKKLWSSSMVSWSDINAWLKQNGNSALYGAGYAGNSLSRGVNNAYADIRLEQNAGKFIVSASVVIDAGQGVAMHKTWTGTKLDSQLKKKFGDNLRFRIQL